MKTVFEKTPEQKEITLKRLTIAVKEAARREQLMRRKAESAKAEFKAAKRASKLAKKAAKKAAKRVRRTQAVLDAWVQQEALAKKRRKRTPASRLAKRIAKPAHQPKATKSKAPNATPPPAVAADQTAEVPSSGPASPAPPN